MSNVTIIKHGEMKRVESILRTKCSTCGCEAEIIEDGATVNHGKWGYCPEEFCGASCWYTRVVPPKENKLSRFLQSITRKKSGLPIPHNGGEL